MRFLIFVLLFSLFFLIEPAFAEEAAADATSGVPWPAVAAALGIAIAAFGGASAQGRATAAALESIGRNPGASGQLFMPMIIGLVLIESLVIYALVIAYLALNL